ncbi:MAG: hypothetical protein JXC85_01165 [Candidatus Aenigmarchaeota archaeon]|nr:hypothetical protein [Candidatus Aenigmarchaeota archaeon]
MLFSKRENLQGLSYFLANRGCFFHRFADSGFRNKWTGFWGRERKFLEFFAVNAGGEWLGTQNARKVEYDFAKAVHHYMTRKGAVRETIFIPDDGDTVFVRIECANRAEFEIKLAVNIRNINENVTDRRYSAQISGQTLRISNAVGSLSFESSAAEQDIVLGGRYEKHVPSGEEQNYYIPGLIKLRGSDIVFAFGPGNPEPGRYQELLQSTARARRGLVRGVIETSSGPLRKGFESAVLSMHLLKRADGYDAGLPWFQQNWGRDSMWALPALVDLGYHRESREMLEYFAKNAAGLCIPNFVSKSMGRSFSSIDATLLWLIGLEHYVRNSGDTGFLAGMEMSVRDFIAFLFARERGGLLQHDFERNETWMDTQRRYCTAVEIQSLYYRALKAAHYVFSFLRREDMRIGIQKRINLLEKAFDKGFLHSGFYADRLDGAGPVREKTANAAMPLIYGPGKRPRAVLDVLKSGAFASRKGTRTLARDQPGYSPRGYHRGSSWSLTTGWCGAAAFVNGDPETGWDMIGKMIDDMESDSLGCIGECWDSESGELIGCPLQLWGAAFLVRLVDDFMLGIDVDAPGNALAVAPRLPRGVERIERKRLIGDRQVSLVFERKGRSTMVSCSDPGIKLIKKP